MNIKPLVDANCYTETIELVPHRSPILFSPIYYQNPGSSSRSPGGQEILFGCPLEPCTVGELKKAPPILEYLVDSIHAKPAAPIGSYIVGQRLIHCTTNSLHCKLDECWTVINEIEQAWTGVEGSDRAIISDLVQGDCRSLIMVFLRPDTPLKRAKRTYRNTFGPFQSQY
jgi:hypothetical protein